MNMLRINIRYVFLAVVRERLFSSISSKKTSTNLKPLLLAIIVRNLPVSILIFLTLLSEIFTTTFLFGFSIVYIFLITFSISLKYLATPYLERRPRALSGGQRQRVALGRAIVRKPKVFLMDEPLSNLDAKLRVAMRSEIVRIHEEVGATTIYVTHDQIEAMTMASRIVVMKDGFIQQIGKPNEIYRHPANMFVAGFIGTPAMNFLHGEITDHDTFKIDDTKFEIRLTLDQQLLLKNYVGKRIVYGIRPENLIYEKMEHFDELKDYVFEYTSTGCELLGDIINVHGRIEENPVILKTPSIYNIPNNTTVRVAINPEFAVFFNETTTKAITPNDNQYEEVERSGALYDDNITIVEEEKTGIVNFIKKTIKKVTNKKEDNKEEVKEDNEQ